jgi:hypothetical protein
MRKNWLRFVNRVGQALPPANLIGFVSPTLRPYRSPGPGPWPPELASFRQNRCGVRASALPPPFWAALPSVKPSPIPGPRIGFVSPVPSPFWGMLSARGISIL